MVGFTFTSAFSMYPVCKRNCSFIILAFLLPTFLQGWGASAHLEAGGFIRTEAGVPHPDIQFHFLPSTIIDHGRKTGYEHAYQVHVGPMRSTSIGQMWLKSKDPREHPLLDAK